MRARFSVFCCFKPVLTAALLSFVAGTVSPAAAQSTAFTYQGSLDDAGAPASGLHDFRFRLFDAASGGVQLGSTLCVDNLTVVEGVFTAQLDFGQQFATAASRFLEIEVRRDTGLNCSNLGGFTIMAPRQQLTATPMASHANAAFALDAADGSPTNAVFVDNSGNVGVGTTTPATKLHVTSAAEGLRIDGPGVGAPNQSYVSFRDANGTRIGFVGDGSTWDNSVYLAADAGDVHLYTAIGAAVTAKPDGNVGIGTTAPAAKLDVRGDIRFGSAGQLHAMGSEDMIRIVHGTVASNGVVNNGTGFSSTRLSVGEYLITFDTAFSGKATITATTLDLNGAVAGMSDNFGTGVRVVTTKGGNRLDSFFDFIAIGPRF